MPIGLNTFLRFYMLLSTILCVTKQLHKSKMELFVKRPTMSEKIINFYYTKYNPLI